MNCPPHDFLLKGGGEVPLERQNIFHMVTINLL